MTFVHSWETTNTTFVWLKVGKLVTFFECVLCMHVTHLCPRYEKDSVLFFLCLETKRHDFTPRLFELSSTTGEFIAVEVVNMARNGETDAFPFLQSDLYSAVQPGMCHHVCTEITVVCAILIIFFMECNPFILD